MSQEGEFIGSCTIITMDSNELASQTNDRMPIIIHVAGYGTWFNPSEGSWADLHKLSEKTEARRPPVPMPTIWPMPWKSSSMP